MSLHHVAMEVAAETGTHVSVVGLCYAFHLGDKKIVSLAKHFVEKRKADAVRVVKEQVEFHSTHACTSDDVYEDSDYDGDME